MHGSNLCSTRLTYPIGSLTTTLMQIRLKQKKTIKTLIHTNTHSRHIHTYSNTHTPIKKFNSEFTITAQLL